MDVSTLVNSETGPEFTFLMLQFGNLQKAVEHWIDSDWNPSTAEMIVLNKYVDRLYDKSVFTDDEDAYHALSEHSGYRHVQVFFR